MQNEPPTSRDLDGETFGGETQTRVASAKLARLFGIEIRVHVSVLVIFALIVSSLAVNLFPQWHPEWSAAVNWSAALSAGLLFFVSLLIHEMSHSVVARRCGIEIAAITLFLFGGVAEMKGEPESPRDEFLIAGAGPLASLVLAVLFAVAASMSVSDPALLLAEEELELAKLGVITTICVWLSTINMMLAIFNLLPGFPMDGGRLFRAALWWHTGDLMRATEMAARVGSGFGWLFIGLGALQVFGGNLVNGLWLVLIGWFIRRLALASVATLMLDQALRGFDVRAIMRTRFETVPAGISARRFIEDYLLRSTQQLWPVVDDGQVKGYVSAHSFNLQDTRLDQATQSIDTYLQGLDAAHSIDPDMSAKSAFERLANHPWPLPVVEHGRIIGIIHQADILRWFSFHKIAT
jgi:Zn-dependent protease